jgi:hypothetical protein
VRKLASSFLALLAGAGCGSRELKIPLPPSYSAIQAVTIGPKCVSCHSSFSSYDGVVVEIVPGNPNASRFYTELQRGSMPQQSPSLSQTELDAIKQWITAGALND